MSAEIEPTTLTERLRVLVAEWQTLAGSQTTPAQRTLSEAADDLLAIVGAPGVTDDDATPCDDEAYSWDHFSPKAVDPYMMRCHVLGSHDVHENSETGATW